MTKSNAERQRSYRERSLKDPDGLHLTRLQVLLCPSARDALDWLIKHTGLTKRKVVEQALLQMAQEGDDLAVEMILDPDVTV